MREGSQGKVCFPAAASGGCYSVLLGDSAGVRRLGRCDPPAPCRARSAASMALRPWPEVFAVTLSSGCPTAGFPGCLRQTSRGGVAFLGRGFGL